MDNFFDEPARPGPGAPGAPGPAGPPRPPRPPRPPGTVEARFVPDRRYTVLAAAGAVGAAAAALLSPDRAGQLLFAVGLLVLAGYVASDLWFSPRLIASGTGIIINAPLTRARLAWAEIDRVHAETRFRRGLRSTTLEIEGAHVLAVFSRRALGVEPDEAAALIEALRPV